MKILTKNDVNQLLCWLTSHSNDVSLELQICPKDETMVAFIYHHMYWNPWTQDAEPWEDYDFVSLIELADMIDCHSALWHEIAESLRAYYYAHISWNKFIKSKDGLKCLCELYNDCTVVDAVEYMKCLFLANKQLHKIEQTINDIYDSINENNSEECDPVLGQLYVAKSNLEYEIDILLNK